MYTDWIVPSNKHFVNSLGGKFFPDIVTTVKPDDRPTEGFIESNSGLATNVITADAATSKEALCEI